MRVLPLEIKRSGVHPDLNAWLVIWKGQVDKAGSCSGAGLVKMTADIGVGHRLYIWDCAKILPDRVFYASTVTHEMVEFYPNCSPGYSTSIQNAGNVKIEARLDPEPLVGLPNLHPRNAVDTSAKYQRRRGTRTGSKPKPKRALV